MANKEIGKLMCGFAGVLGELNSDIRDSFLTSSNKINYRGPDDNSIFDEENLLINFFRLSIIDIDQGNQPKKSSDNRYTLFFNGEIYNYIELKDDLIKEGVQFETESDTEVLLQVFVNFGLEGIKKLSGMFSICLIDNFENTIYLIRDQFGIKPLYYLIDEGKFFFSSEAKVLYDFSKRELHEEGLMDYLAFQFYLETEKLIKNVNEIQPGHYLKIDKNNHNYENIKYFEPTFYSENENNINDLKNAIEKSIEKQIRADVRVGTQLSGGLDSSIITSITSNYVDNLIAFHGYFPGASEKFSEVSYAEEVAQHCNIELIKVPITKDDFIENFSTLIEVLDYPIVGPGALPQFMVDKEASKHVKVILTGQGGDEIFAGYARYLLNYLEQTIKGTIYSTNNKQYLLNLNNISGSLPSLKSYIPLLREMWKKDLFLSPENRYFHLLFREIPDDWFVKKNDFHKQKEKFLETFNQIKEKSLINTMIHFDSKFVLTGLLHVEDRISMYHSLESRVPLLDQDVYTTATNLPLNLKFGEGDLKKPLKMVAKDYLPKNIIERKNKMGFPVPINEWLQDQTFKQFVVDTIKDSPLFDLGIFNYEIIIKDLSKINDFDRSLWGLLCLSQWFKIYLK